MKKKILSIDAETNGLWGKAFSIAAILYSANGFEKERFIGRCPINGEINEWVEKNVLPEMIGIPETHDSYESLIRAFCKFYLASKGDDVDIIVHMGLPVEARLFIDAREMGYIGDWDAPYPLIDISALPGIETSVDNYNVRNGLTEGFIGGPHNPLHDCTAAAAAYFHWRKNFRCKWSR